MTENFYKSLDRLIIHLSGHCRNHRLVDLRIERLPPSQRREAITATLDYFELEVAHLVARTGSSMDSVPGDNAGEEHLRSRDTKSQSIWR